MLGSDFTATVAVCGMSTSLIRSLRRSRMKGREFLGLEVFGAIVRRLSSGRAAALASWRQIALTLGCGLAGLAAGWSSLGSGVLLGSDGFHRAPWAPAPFHVHGGDDESEMACLAGEPAIADESHAITALYPGVSALDAAANARRPGIEQPLPGVERMIVPSTPRRRSVGDVRFSRTPGRTSCRRNSHARRAATALRPNGSHGQWPRSSRPAA
jgi:hypothetical protein